MALSWSGETAELKDLIDYSRRFRIGLIAVTAGGGQHARRRRPTSCSLLPQAREACPHNLAPTTSTADAARARRRARGRAAREPRLHRARFRQAASRRPARRDAEVRPRRHAHRRRRFRWSRLGTPMAEAMVEMSAKGFGCVGIIDASGEPRRHHHGRRPAPPHAARPARRARSTTVMTRAPKTVQPDQLASEALEIINSSKITALIVVEAGKPVGIVHLHDLLRAGIARSDYSQWIDCRARPGNPSFFARRWMRGSSPRMTAQLLRLDQQIGAVGARDPHAAAGRAVRTRHPPDRVVDPDGADAVDDRLVERELAPDIALGAAIEERLVDSASRPCGRSAARPGSSATANTAKAMTCACHDQSTRERDGADQDARRARATA